MFELGLKFNSRKEEKTLARSSDMIGSRKKCCIIGK
jgi:hypothetical protein